MIELDNRTDKTYDFERLHAIASDLTTSEIELIITNDAEMTEINRECRGIDKATDVLSFPSYPFPGAPLGSIIISSDHVEAVASQLNHSPDDELSLLFIHGILHLLGMDHETDQGEMRRKESELVSRFSLPSSLIVRTLEQ